MLSAAARYSRAGYRPLTPAHEALALAAEALRGGAALEQLTDLSCGLAVVHERAVLLIHQKTATGSHWALPKGHPEAGESDLMAALREVREEAGLRISGDCVAPGAWAESRYTIVGKLWGEAWRAHADFPNEALRACVYHKTARFALARLPPGAPRPPVTLQAEEVLASEWLPAEEGIEKLTFEDERVALRALLQHLE